MSLLQNISLRCHISKLTQNTRNILKRFVEMINPIIMKIAHDMRIHLENIVQVGNDKLANLRMTQLHSGFKHVVILR